MDQILDFLVEQKIPDHKKQHAATLVSHRVRIRSFSSSETDV